MKKEPEKGDFSFFSFSEHWWITSSPICQINLSASTCQDCTGCKLLYFSSEKPANFGFVWFILDIRFLKVIACSCHIIFPQITSAWFCFWTAPLSKLTPLDSHQHKTSLKKIGRQEEERQKGCHSSCRTSPASLCWSVFTS